MLRAFSADPSPPWRDLFNGRDLTGWKIVGPATKASARADQGELVGGHARAHGAAGAVQSARGFQDQGAHGAQQSGVLAAEDQPLVVEGEGPGPALGVLGGKTAVL